MDIRARFLAGAFAGLVPSIVMWGFTVDDAFIPVRFAQNLAQGLGYRFYEGGPVVDAVTPLPYAFVLAALAFATDAIGLLVRAKVLGIVVWTVSASALGASLASEAERHGQRLRDVWGVLGVLALAYPIGAWAASGLETAWATSLVTWSVILRRRPRRSAVLAGISAAVRPELVVWAIAWTALRERSSPRTIASSVGLAIAPFVVVTIVRLACFGSPAPLSLLAKPSDLSHGIAYVAAATLVVLFPLAVFAPTAWARLEVSSRALLVAFALHLVAVAVVGGDWMPYARLLVPVTPTLTFVTLDLARKTTATTYAVRTSLAVAVGVAMCIVAAPAGRHVQSDRERLVAMARPLLGSAGRVAALDVGWVSAATPAPIVDLAGLTDPVVAALPGGHTSKRVDVGMLLERDVDTVVVYGKPRAVERRLLESPLFVERFVPANELVYAPAERAASYTIYVRRVTSGEDRTPVRPL